jgi:hypothetical protein
VITLDNARRVVCWFSCGTSSAAAAKIAIGRLARRPAGSHQLVVARCIVPEEHEDNDRFAADCEAWFGHPVMYLSSTEYASCEDVWMRERYMSGHSGARCTVEMKKAVRWAFERDFAPDLQVFGFTSEERPRAKRFRENNPDVNLCVPLIDASLTKANAHAMASRVNIELPAMYRLGFNNANCVGCVAASGPRYWNRIRRHFPETFERRAVLSRELGVRLVRTTTIPRVRLFLDELDPALDDDDPEPTIDCGLACQIAEQETA